MLIGFTVFPVAFRAYGHIHAIQQYTVQNLYPLIMLHIGKKCVFTWMLTYWRFEYRHLIVYLWIILIERLIAPTASQWQIAFSQRTILQIGGTIYISKDGKYFPTWHLLKLGGVKRLGGTWPFRTKPILNKLTYIIWSSRREVGKKHSKYDEDDNDLH